MLRLRATVGKEKRALQSTCGQLVMRHSVIMFYTGYYIDLQNQKPYTQHINCVRIFVTAAQL